MYMRSAHARNTASPRCRLREAFGVRTYGMCRFGLALNLTFAIPHVWGGVHHLTNVSRSVYGPSYAIPFQSLESFDLANDAASRVM
jgi:hypothetical protein